MKLSVLLALVSATQAIKIEEKSKVGMKIQTKLQTKQMVEDPYAADRDLQSASADVASAINDYSSDPQAAGSLLDEASRDINSADQTNTSGVDSNGIANLESEVENAQEEVGSSSQFFDSAAD